MLNIPKWKLALSIIICFYSVFIVMSGFLESKTTKTINLGLDLRGGAYLLLEIDQKAYFKEKIKILKEEVRNKLRSSKTGYSNLILDDGKILFNLRDTEAKLYDIFKDLGQDIAIKQEKKE